MLQVKEEEIERLKSHFDTCLIDTSTPRLNVDNDVKVTCNTGTDTSEFVNKTSEIVNDTSDIDNDTSDNTNDTSNEVDDTSNNINDTSNNINDTLDIAEHVSDVSIVVTRMVDNLPQSENTSNNVDDTATGPIVVDICANDGLFVDRVGSNPTNNVRHIEHLRDCQLDDGLQVRHDDVIRHHDVTDDGLVVDSNSRRRGEEDGLESQGEYSGDNEVTQYERDNSDAEQYTGDNGATAVDENKGDNDAAVGEYCGDNGGEDESPVPMEWDKYLSLTTNDDQDDHAGYTNDSENNSDTFKNSDRHSDADHLTSRDHLTSQSIPDLSDSTSSSSDQRSEHGMVRQLFLDMFCNNNSILLRS